MFVALGIVSRFQSNWHLSEGPGSPAIRLAN